VKTATRVRIDIDAGEAWSDAALAFLDKAPTAARAAWSALFKHCRTADGPRPTKKWLAEAAKYLESVGQKAFAAAVAEWFPLLNLPRTRVVPVPTRSWRPDGNLLFTEANSTLLKGVAWTCAHVGAEHNVPLARALADAATACFKKVKWLGPRNVRIGSAAIWVLSAMPGPEPAAQLARLKSQIKQPTGKKNVEKALAALGQRTGQTPDDIEELAIPTFNLSADGVLRQALGDYTAELRITGSTDVTLQWSRKDGKPQKSVPAEVKRDHPNELKELQRTAKELDKMLPAQRTRLERLPMNDRSWSLVDWKQRYLDHPLVSRLARRLIWQFESGKKTAAAIPIDGQFLAANDKPIAQPASDARVRVWHPIAAQPDEVLAWRRFLERRQIVQPFKQAHREVYLLTDAERRTKTYSNRFAAHIIRQHQFVALGAQRGWRTRLIGGWDSGGDGTPTLQLPRWNLRVEFWTDYAAGGAGGLAASGVSLYLSTDQVRFYEADATRPLRLDKIPPIVFSEVMRDVDLFIAVCSIGNDPAWQDTGPRGAWRNYWNNYSFGELTESAKTRKATLEPLLPRLKIRDRATLTDKFLVVKGNLRTYKIHLGSGNILMEPNDQYLCIVPDRTVGAAAKDDNLFLPFEGDSTLSLILSKAFLLADDDRIKDPTITQQIKRKK
jgi:hypothetical protein